MSHSEGNKRIAKNTFMLYIRMIFIMVVTLFTSRIVLEILGIEDFGIYNVVAGVVTFLSFINTSMASGTLRFMTYAIGKNDARELVKVFSLTLILHCCLAFVVFLLAESIGLWFLLCKLQIPAGRMIAAQWVYQFAIFSLICGFLQVPYYALIMAHERMSFFALISTVEVIIKLVAVVALIGLDGDKLLLYGFLIFLSTLIIYLFYFSYCRIKFAAIKFRFLWDRMLFSEISSFSCWNIFGNLSIVGYTQGLNIVLNLIFGPALNAAFAVANQVNVAVRMFVQNFQMAMNPQIIKSHASHDQERMLTLIYAGAKYSYFLMFLVGLPVFLECEFLLDLWLNEVPVYTPILVRYFLVTGLVNSLSGPLITAAQATGKIRRYQTIVGSILLLNVPLSYIALQFFSYPFIIGIIMVGLALVAFLARIILLQKMISLSFSVFCKKVLLPTVATTCSALILPLILSLYAQDSWWKFILVSTFSVISVITSVYFCGLDKPERTQLNVLLTRRCGLS